MPDNRTANRALTIGEIAALTGAKPRATPSTTTKTQAAETRRGANAEDSDA